MTIDFSGFGTEAIFVGRDGRIGFSKHGSFAADSIVSFTICVDRFDLSFL